MSESPTSSLGKAIEDALSRLEGTSADTDIQKLVERVVDSLKTSQYTNHKVFEQLSSLSTYIANTRNEISTIRADSISGEHIPQATDQLDAVVGATEEATNKIMDSCDAISTIAGELPAETQTKLMDVVNNIYEACNFQDITGQRITKVVRTLKHIEDRVESLVSSLEQLGFRIEKVSSHKLELSKATDTEKHLLNGPQLGGDGINQDDIDKLFG